MDTLEQLAQGDSVIHRLHPMVKLLSCLLFIVAVISVGRYEIGGLIPYLFYPFLLIPLSDTPFRPLLKRLVLALPFSLFAGISNIIFDTQIAVHIAGIGISFGFISFLVICMKTYLTVMAVLLLVSTTSLQELSNQMIRLKIPAVIVMLITMTYRYINILLNEAATMFTAYLLRSPKARGIEMRHMGSFIGQLLLRSIDRAERVYAAMKCRGYHGAMGYASKRKASWKDIVFCVIIVGAVLIFRFLNFTQIIGSLFI